MNATGPLTPGRREMGQSRAGQINQYRVCGRLGRDTMDTLDIRACVKLPPEAGPRMARNLKQSSRQQGTEGGGGEQTHRDIEVRSVRALDLVRERAAFTHAAALLPTTSVL